MIPQICFVTRNDFKAEEFDALFSEAKVNLVRYRNVIHEIQTDDMEAIIRDKVKKAFALFRRPVIVDHSGLEIEALGGLPKGLTQLFWDTLKEQGVCRLVKALDQYQARAIVSLGFCDGKKIHVFHESLSGTIVPDPRGARNFQWDTIFVPDGHGKTYSEMDVETKNTLSQRATATRKLLESLKARRII
jgi:XTP/dITP diphosphohydrolase